MAVGPFPMAVNDWFRNSTARAAGDPALPATLLARDPWRPRRPPTVGVVGVFGRMPRENKDHCNWAAADAGGGDDEGGGEACGGDALPALAVDWGTAGSTCCFFASA